MKLNREQSYWIFIGGMVLVSAFFDYLDDEGSLGRYGTIKESLKEDPQQFYNMILFKLVFGFVFLWIAYLFREEDRWW